MIDTLVLVLNKGMFYINDPERFEPSAKWVLSEGSSMGRRGYIPSKQNPTAQELKNGIYKPKLTLTNRISHSGNREASLKVELSLPKLLYGNNFDELQNEDFDLILEKLRKSLKDMGVMVFSKALSDAPISSVHYSKNIPLTDGSTPYYYIKKIAEANIKLSLDVNQTDFRNEGHSLKWHCNSYEVTFYDKLKDLKMAKTSEKRSIESDNVIQLGLFDQLQAKSPFEVLRMEIRLNKRQKIKQIIKAIGYDVEPTFKSLFSFEISQKILLQYLHEMESRRPALLDYQSDKPGELLADLIVNNSTLGLKRTLQVFGLKYALDSIGMREIREMFSRYSNRSWHRLVEETNKIRLPVKKDVFGMIRNYLTAFEPLKLVDFQDQMLNNDKYES